MSVTPKYEAINGIPMKEYKRAKAKQYYIPRSRNKVYKTLPSEAKELVYRMHEIKIGLEKICKVINTDPRFEGVYIGKNTAGQLLKDKEEREKFGKLEIFDRIYNCSHE